MFKLLLLAGVSLSALATTAPTTKPEQTSASNFILQISDQSGKPYEYNNYYLFLDRYGYGYWYAGLTAYSELATAWNLTAGVLTGNTTGYDGEASPQPAMIFSACYLAATFEAYDTQFTTGGVGIETQSGRLAVLISEADEAADPNCPAVAAGADHFSVCAGDFASLNYDRPTLFYGLNETERKYNRCTKVWLDVVDL